MKRLFLTLLLASPLALAQLAAGCNAQGEGQLCSVLNNTNDDCAAGLTCKSVPGSGASVCCSPNSTNVACIGSIGTTTSTGTGTTSTTSSTSGTGGTGGKSGTGGMSGTGTGGSIADAGDGG